MNRTSFTLVAAAAALALTVSACYQGGDTVTGVPGEGATGISVSGTGRAFGAPDIVLLRLGVQAEASSVSEAREQAARTAKAVIDSTKRNGVDDKDVRTAQFSIQPVYESTRSGTPVIRGYRVVNTLNIKVRKVENAGKIIDDAAEAGGNNTVVQSIAFSIDDPTKLQEQARDAAMKQARDKAEQMARVAGVRLGKPITISEGGGPIPLYAGPELAAVSRAADVATPIESGELEVNVTVTVLYKID